MPVTVEQLEDRVNKVEIDLKEIKFQIPLANELKRPWLDRIYGAFENNDAFSEAISEALLKERPSRFRKTKPIKNTGTIETR